MPRGSSAGSGSGSSSSAGGGSGGGSSAAGGGGPSVSGSEAQNALKPEVLGPIAGCSLTLVNVTATANMKCPIDLKTVVMRARNAEYNPKRFSACVSGVGRCAHGWLVRLVLLYPYGGRVVEACVPGTVCHSFLQALVEPSLGFKLGLLLQTTPCCSKCFQYRPSLGQSSSLTLACCAKTSSSAVCFTVWLLVLYHIRSLHQTVSGCCCTSQSLLRQARREVQPPAINDQRSADTALNCSTFE